MYNTKEDQLSPEQVESLNEILDIMDQECCLTIEEIADATEIDLTLLEKYLDISAAKKKLILL